MPSSAYVKEVITGLIGYVVEDFEHAVHAIRSGEIATENCKQQITGEQKIVDGGQWYFKVDGG